MYPKSYVEIFVVTATVGCQPFLTTHFMGRSERRDYWFSYILNYAIQPTNPQRDGLFLIDLIPFPFSMKSLSKILLIDVCIEINQTYVYIKQKQIAMRNTDMHVRISVIRNSLLNFCTFRHIIVMASVNLQEKANFTRLSRLLVDKGTEALRATLDAIHSRGNLPAVLNANKLSLLKLKPRIINNIQWDLLFPPSGSPPDSKKFDVTLLMVLFRNICGLPPPATGWNTMPPSADNSIQANVTRIKLFRNEVYAHATSTQVDNATFENLWQRVSQTLVDLNIPQVEIDDLKGTPLGPEEEIYVNSLKEWYLNEEDCKNMLDEIQSDVKSIKRKLDETDLQQQNDRDTLANLTQMTEGNRCDIQQLRKCQRYDSGETKVSEKHTDSPELLERLAKHNFKSKISRKIKSFHSGTRNWLIKKVESWFTTNEESKLLLISAGPGFGKSVFAAKICNLFGEKGKLAACHFCDFSNSNLNDPMMMLESLASQMCDNIAGFKDELCDQLKRRHKVNNLNDAFQIYLQNPLDDLEVELKLIVIDGLDESASASRSEMVKLIGDHFPDLPNCVKVLLTSRPGLCVQELDQMELDQMEFIEVDTRNKQNQSDLHVYLSVCLPQLANRVSASPRELSIIDTIVEKCEGSFLYAFHVQKELCKRDNLAKMTSDEIVSFLPKGMGSVFQAYFRRLEVELEAVLGKSSKSDLLKVLEMFVSFEIDLPLQFIPRALGVDLDCRETKRILKKVNDAISCLLYVSDDLFTVFHKSVCDWLLGNGYEDHEYTVKIIDGKERLWQVCEQIFTEMKRNVISGCEVKLTEEVTHALEYGHEYLFECKKEGCFHWVVDVIIVHIISTVYPKSTAPLHKAWKEILRTNVAINNQLRHKVSWHLIEVSYAEHHAVETSKPFFYLESVIDHSPKGLFSDDEIKTAQVILDKFPRCVKWSSQGTTSIKPILAQLFPLPISAVGISASKKLVAVAMEDGVISVLSLPELVKLWHCSTQCKSISCCTFAPDDTVLLYGMLEKVLCIAEKKEVPYWSGQVERFKSCAFSPNGNRLATIQVGYDSRAVKLWDVSGQNLVSVLCAGGPLDCCCFTKTGVFVVGNVKNPVNASHCVWSVITYQRVDQRSLSRRNLKKKDGNRRSEICNRCFRPAQKELIPCNGLPALAINRFKSFSLLSHMISMSDRKNASTRIVCGTYNEADCIFYLHNKECLRVIESTHLTTLAVWAVFISDTIMFNFSGQDLEFIDFSTIKDDLWLYSDQGVLAIFSSDAPGESQLSLPRPTSVLWCSFSPDGTRVATVTSDGFLNIWNVNTCVVYQRFSSIDASTSTSAACCWSDKCISVFHVIDKTPNVLVYPCNEEHNITTTQILPVALSQVVNEFLHFSGILDFCEGHVSFDCGRIEPVKVIDVRKVDDPKILDLPGIRPNTSIAISTDAFFVLGAESKYILWKMCEGQTSVYEKFVEFGCDPFSSLPWSFRPILSECCFSNDSKFAIVSSVIFAQRNFFVIDTNTGICKTGSIGIDELPTIVPAPTRVFCNGTAIILVTQNVIEIFELKNWKRLEKSFQRHITKDLVTSSKLSPKGNVLVVPDIAGGVKFFRLDIPESHLQCQENPDRIFHFSGVVGNLIIF